MCLSPTFQLCMKVYNKCWPRVTEWGRVSNCVTWFLNQFEIEAMEIGNLLTEIKEDSSSMLATI